MLLSRIHSNLPKPTDGAFTLIEVILAMAIAAGILMVVLFFYRQSETLRSNLLDETARASAARLVMERMSQELSAALDGGTASFSGSSDRIQFVKLDFPQLNAWTNPPAAAGVTPFCVVTYSLSQSTNSGASGLLRLEQYIGAKTVGVISSNDTAGATPTNGPASAFSTNGDLDSQSPAPAATGQPRRNGSLISQIQYVRFRYWDSTNWLDAWTGSGTPAGVEVSLGNDPMPDDESFDAQTDTGSEVEYPYELYRRVIYVPNHAASPAGTNSDASFDSGGAGS